MSEAVMKITMESDSLSALRNDIDGMISRTLKTMHMTQNSEATVTAKIKITLNNEMVPSPDGPRKIVRPVFEHEVQSVVQAKDKMSGTMNGEYELVYDAEKDEWYMKSTRSQISMFDEQSADESAVQVSGYIEKAVLAVQEGSEKESEETDEGNVGDDENNGYEPDDDPDYDTPDEYTPDFEDNDIEPPEK